MRLSEIKYLCLVGEQLNRLKYPGLPGTHPGLFSALKALFSESCVFSVSNWQNEQYF